MTNLKEIVEKIKNKNLSEALKLCDNYNDKMIKTKKQFLYI